MTQRFSLCLSNPPYQGASREENNEKEQVYPFHMDVANFLACRALLIHPAKFLFRAGGTTKEWTDKILVDRSLEVKLYDERPNGVFPEASIRGGVCVTERVQGRIDGGLHGEFIYPVSMVEKVRLAHQLSGKTSTPMFDSLVSSRGLYKLVSPPAPKVRELPSNAFSAMGHLFAEQPSLEKNLPVLGILDHKRTARYMNSSFLRTPTTLDTWRLAIAKGNGNGAFGESLGFIDLLPPGTAHTDSFLSVGPFVSREEADSCRAYMATTFFRELMGVRKKTQNVTGYVFGHCPLVPWDRSWTEEQVRLYLEELSLT